MLNQKKITDYYKVIKKIKKIRIIVLVNKKNKYCI